MAYTEIKNRNKRKYFYRVLSIRRGNKVSKKREYLGVNLSKEQLSQKEKYADKKLNSQNKSRIKSKNHLENIKPKIIKILKKNKIKRAGIFGSFARGEAGKKSDIDLLIEPPKGIGLGFAGIQIKLENILKRKVDLLSYSSISPHLKSRILKEEIRII